jgi:hypothetical protein
MAEFEFKKKEFEQEMVRRREKLQVSAMREANYSRLR